MLHKLRLLFLKPYSVLLFLPYRLRLYFPF
nr:MAG TPA: hypothetical protein [Caudoviricetes sp.]